MSRHRIRTVKPEFFSDEKVGALSHGARLTFIGLITMADDEGRLRDLPGQIRAHIFPWDEATVTGRRLQRFLSEVADAGLILRYEVGFGKYIAIRHWTRHQRINKAMPSTLPEPPDAVLVEENAIHDSGETKTSQQIRGAISEAMRRAVAKREGAIPGEDVEVGCHYCGRPGLLRWARTPSGRASSWIQVEGFEFDHVVPLAAGGETTVDNLVLACQRCNRGKGARTEYVGNDVRDSVHDGVRDASRVGARPLPSTPIPSSPSSESTAEEQQKVPRAKSHPVDPDSLPKDFPAALTPILDATLPTLLRLQDERGGIVPTRRGAAQALKAWPDRDHLGELSKFEHYYTAGGGASADVGDWPRRLRTWLEKAPAASAGRPAVNVRDERRKRGADALRNLMASTEEAA